MLHTLRFFLSSKCRLFHNATFFGSCVIHILYTECAKIKKKKIRRQRVKRNGTRSLVETRCHQIRITCTGTPVQRCVYIAHLFIIKKPHICTHKVYISKYTILNIGYFFYFCYTLHAQIVRI